MPELEIISSEPNGSLRFGDHTLTAKQKSDDYEVNGDVYRVKSHSEITRAEKNGKLLFESVPGTSVRDFSLDEKCCEFLMNGRDNTRVTIELEPEREYRIYIDGVNAGNSMSNRSSKLSFSVDLHNEFIKIKIERV